VGLRLDKLGDSLVAKPPVVPWPVVVRRLTSPADVERFLVRLDELRVSDPP